MGEKDERKIGGVPHSYKVQLIRKPIDPVLRREETVELERVCKTYREALHWATLYGAFPRRKQDVFPKIKGTRAIYPCKDQRFARVQIVIQST